MATITITKGLIGEEDLKIQDSTTTTFSRATSSGGSNTLTKLARSTLLTSEHDVIQYGAVGNGVTDDTAAIQAAITACATAGGTIVFPPGYTFRVVPTAIDTPIFTLSATNPLTFVMYGATIYVTSLTSLDPSTAAYEKTVATVFLGLSMDRITFLGGTIDLNRDYVTQDPKLSFYKGNYTSYVTFRDVTFKDCSNYYGCITMDSTVSSSVSKWHSLTIENCTFEKSVCGIWLEGAFRNVTITGCKFRHMDIAPHDANLEGAFADGYGAGGTKKCQSIKLYASLAYDATDTVNGGTVGDTQSITITGNTFYGGHRAIDVQARALGDAADVNHYRDLTITGNTIWGVAGIYVQRWSNVLISGNSLSAILSSDISTYDDTAIVNSLTSANYVASTASAVMIEAAKSKNIVVSGNMIDGGYDYTTQARLVYGIDAGEYTLDIVSDCTIIGNHIRRCQYAISTTQVDNSIIADNVVRECGYAFTGINGSGLGSARNTASTYKNNVLRGNTFIADATAAAVGSSLSRLCFTDGDWLIENNTFIGLATEVADYRLLKLAGWDQDDDGTADQGSVTLRGNTFRKFNYTPVETVGGTSATTDEFLLRLHMAGNVFDPDQAGLATTVGCVKIGRAAGSQSLAVTGTGNSCTRLKRAFILTYPETDGATSSYNFGPWEHDQNSDTTSTWRLFDDIGTNTGATGFADVFRSGRGIQTRTMQINCNGAGATTVISNALPFGIIWHVSARNDSLLTMGSSGAGYVIGYARGSTASFDAYWGSVDALTADTASNTTIDAFPTTPLLIGTSTTENDIILTAKLASGARGGTFTSGQVIITVYYTPAFADDF